MLAGVLTAAVARAAEPFDYFRNSWAVIGLKDYQDGTRLTPANELELAAGSKIRLRFGRDLTPLSRAQTKTLLDGWLPIVNLSADDGSVRYEFKLWATPLPMVTDWQRAFDGPVDGENFLNWITVRATNTGAQVMPARLRAERYGPLSQMTETVASLGTSLEPGQHVDTVIRVPFSPVTDELMFEAKDAELWCKRAEEYWRDLMARAARIEVPCVKSTQALLAAHVCQLIASDHGELHGGEGFYDDFYIRDAGYQLMELEEAGLFDAAAKAVACYLRSQRPDGRFETQKGQLDANGQALWVLWQYYKITGDRDWLAGAYPQMRRAAEWIMKARSEAPADSPYAGVLPAAVADGEYLWDGRHHIVGYDLWNLRGMLCTTDAARALGKEAEAAELSAEAEEYRAAIDAAWRRTGLPHFPPSWEGEGTHWGNTETLWPTELFETEDPRVVALIDHALNRHGGGFVEGTIQWFGHGAAIHPYMSAYTTMASLSRGEHEQVVEDFYWYLLHSTATQGFPEGIYHERRHAWSHTLPHVTGASNYAVMLRHMLVHERGRELHLLSAVPDGWLGEGREIVVERAPTHFGSMSLHVLGTSDGVKVTLEPPTRDPPARIVLHLPESRPLINALPHVEIRTRPDQKQRWDFPTVVERYHANAPLLWRPIPGLVALPPSRALDVNQCRLMDLEPVANTDPFTAPFGVADPEKVFTGMPTGVQTVGGVPFEIIDPAGNDGRGTVVLHSPQAPSNRNWPQEVEIPVGETGKGLYFLGNVHGWGLGGGEGVGEWGAVAEYVIHYADGHVQTVPLIAERTADDWTARRQLAAEAFRGLSGQRWHLNVLGVQVRQIRIEKIVFRDLGTRAAPLLVAVTLERK
jgi:hypothetical protein